MSQRTASAAAWPARLVELANEGDRDCAADVLTTAAESLERVQSPECAHVAAMLRRSAVIDPLAFFPGAARARRIPTTDGRVGTRDAAARIGVRPSVLRNWRCRGDGPPFVKLGALVTYFTSDLDTWIAAHRVTPVTNANMRERAHVARRETRKSAQLSVTPRHLLANATALAED